MTFKGATYHEDRAHQQRRDGSHGRAGDEYVRAAYEYLGDGWDHAAINQLIMATLCYRLADREDQVAFCEQFGEALCQRNYRDAVDAGHETGYWAMKPGMWEEFRGDLLLVAGNDRWESQYRSAIEAYREAGDVDLSAAEIEHIKMIYRALARGAGRPEDYETVLEMEMHYNEGTCSDLISFKRETFPEYVATITERGEWIWDDPD